MGVHGLWRLIEPSGKPVPVESLENKILAVDVSIWLHQAIKGFHDSKGAPAINAHLLGIFHRVCKLLYFKIKPVFVFDGGVPVLKRETIAKRNKWKQKNISEADKIQKQLLDTLIKHSAVNKVLGEKAKSELASVSSKQEKSGDYLFKLPKEQVKSEDSNDEDSSESDFHSSTKHWNLHNIDTRSEHFKSLPANVRHEILTELKETRKQSSWGRLHELPTQSDDFSGFQMKRLLKRKEVQTALEDAVKEMGGHSLSLIEIEEILKDQGVISNNVIGNRIASDENTRYLYICDVKKALEKARHEEEKIKLEKIKKKDHDKIAFTEENSNLTDTELSKADLELEEDIQKAIALSLQDVPSGSGQPKGKKLSNFSFLENFDDISGSDSEKEDSQCNIKNTKLASAQNYMMEHSGLTPNEVLMIIADKEKSETRKRKLTTIVEERYGFESAQKKPKYIEKPSIKKIEISEQKDATEKSSRDLNDDWKKNERTEDNTFLLNEDCLVLKEFNGTSSTKVINLINHQEKAETDFQESKKKNLKCEMMHKTSVDEILKEDLTVGLMSESKESDDDFEDVKEIVENERKLMEINFEVGEFNEEDDIFADIFEIKINSEENNGKKLQEDGSNKFPFEERKILSEMDLQSLRDDLDKEELELRNEQGLRERLGTNITDQMYQEAQDLLELFGLPYVVAPMEAEAQCAFLEAASLTDGTITDDSDIWLFGGKTVYKNFFNQSKHVLEYRAEDIKHHFKLTREQMILLALLVGSDYTTGLQGVGPVTAMEILANFPPSSTSSLTLSHNQLLMGLKEFKSWFMSGKSIARSKNSLRNKLKNVTFTEGFPSMQVVQAYLNPTVDHSEEKFSWSKPDIVGLIDFGRTKFGWNKLKTEDILKPVLKKTKESKYQSTLLNYFKIKHDLNAEEAQKLMSERVRLAVNKIGQDPKDEGDNSDQEPQKQIKNKEKDKIKGDHRQSVKRKVRKKTTDIKDLISDEEFIDIDQLEAVIESAEKEKNKKGKKKKVEKQHKLLEKGSDEHKAIEEIKVSSETVEYVASSKEKNSNSLLENKEMNLHIKVLCHLETNASENADKIAKVKKIAGKIEKVMNPKQKEEKELKSKHRKEMEKSDENEDEKVYISKNENKKLRGKSIVGSKVKKQIEKGMKNEPSTSNAEENLEEEVELLKETKAFSNNHKDDIMAETEEIIQQQMNKERIVQRKLHRKENIPQRERAQRNMISTRLRAIEVFRKSKIDLSIKKTEKHKARLPKEDAELSESSSDSDL